MTNARKLRAFMVEAPGIESWGGGIEGNPTGANLDIGDDAIPTDATLGGDSIPPKDDSGTIPGGERRRLIAASKAATSDPTLIGDLVLARVVAALLSHILGQAGSPAEQQIVGRVFSR